MPKLMFKLTDEQVAQIEALGVPQDGFIQVAVQEKLDRETLAAVEPEPRVIALPDGSQIVTNVPMGQAYAIPISAPVGSTPQSQNPPRRPRMAKAQKDPTPGQA